MAGAYIPPHLRKKSPNEQSSASASSPSKQQKQPNEALTQEEIHNHFWPITGGQFSTHGSQSKTLHDSAAAPGELAFVLLFCEANPRWDDDRIIFTKSNLELLPQASLGGLGEAGPELNGSVETSTTVDDSPDKVVNQAEDARGPIAVFKQGHRGKADFRFEGWFQIERVAFLEPKSDELVRMLEQKWMKTDRKGNVVMRERRGKGWEESLSYRWAVVKFTKDDKAEQERGVPEVQKLPDPQYSRTEPSKSVNEMLAEMRLRDTAGQERAADG